MTAPTSMNMAERRNSTKKNNPCTNRIERCCMAGCLSDVWSYNFEEHFNENHQQEVFPANMVMSDAEKKHILAL